MLHQQPSSGQVRSQPVRLLSFSFLLMLVGVVMLLLTLAAEPDAASAAPPSQGGTVPPGTVPPPTPSLILLSAKRRGEAETANSELRFHDDDIVAFVPSTGQLGLYFDGSAHGLGRVNIGDFEVLADDGFIFTLNVPFKIPNPNGSPNPLAVDDSDIVQYHPISDSFSIFLTGAEIGLTKGGEDIDALAFAPDGRLLISTIGSAEVPGVSGDDKARDEDLLACDLTTTPKTCNLYFDGSDLKLTRGNEDVTAAWMDPNGAQTLYLATKGKFKAQGSASSVNGDRTVVFGCTPLSLDDTSDLTDCSLAQFFDAEDFDWENQIDGLWVTFAVSPTLTLEPTTPLSVAQESQDEDVIDSADYAETMNEASTEIDPDLDAYDFAEVVEQLYMPFMRR